MDSISSSNELILEGPLLKLPIELLKTNLKSQQKVIDKDVTWMSSVVKSLESCKTPEDTQEPIQNMLTRLRQMKRKVEDLREEEAYHIQCSHGRLEHLHALCLPDQETEQADLRLRRMVLEFMLRQGFSDTAKKLSEIHNMANLLDINIFAQSKAIVDALKRGSTQECIAWCNEHKTTLRKSKNSLEFELRRQDFIELVRQGLIPRAIQYAHKHLVAHREPRQREVDRICALLCFKPDTNIEPYKSLYASPRWDFLAELFKNTLHFLYNIPSKSPLEIALSAGLSALKTTSCYNCDAPDITASAKSRPLTCPICSPELNKLAREVPFAHAVRSHLVDSMTGKSMEGDNQPVVLPNGRVYGAATLKGCQKSTGLRDQLLRDPVTEETFPTAALRKAYVL